MSPKWKLLELTRQIVPSQRTAVYAGAWSALGAIHGTNG